MEVDQKRKLACDSCKKKKLKCEWEQDQICIRCSRTDTECVPQPKHERKKREKKPNTYLSSLEDRLQRMEAAMKTANTLGAPAPSQDRDGATIVDRMSLLSIKDDGSSIFVGAASGFSIFSPQGLKWIYEKTEDDKFAKMFTNLTGPSTADKNILGSSMWHPMSDEECGALPPKDVALSLIDNFFRGFGAIIPLFDEAAFRRRFDTQYPISRSDDISWFACLNVAFAISSIGEEGPNSVASSPSSPIEYKVQDMEGWKWFRNACSTFVELQFQEGSLPGVQAMVGMAFLLQTIPDPYPCMVVSGVALRMAQTMGIHRNVVNSGLSASDLEQRRSAFWIALMIERGVCFRMGRPSVVHEDDLGIDLPRPERCPPHFGLARDMAKISLLQGRIYNKLYSAKSLSQTTSERLQWVGILDEELQQWRDGVAAEIRPGNTIPTNLNPRELTPILILHFTYFNALTIIHRVSNHLGPWTDTADSLFGRDPNEAKLNPRVFAGGAICVNAARSIIGLLNACTAVIESGEFNVIRIMSYYPLAASLMLFASVLENPWGSRALQDVERMESVVDFLIRFYGDPNSPESAFLKLTFGEVNRVAREHVGKAQMQGHQGPKRTGDRTDFGGSRQAKKGSPASDAPSKAPVQSPDDPYASVMHAQDILRLADNSVRYSSTPPSVATSELQAPLQPFLGNTPPSLATSELQAPPQPFVGNTPQVENDPVRLLDESDPYGNSNFLIQDQTTQWTGTDDFFMPLDGSWFFPITNQWDLDDQMGAFPNDLSNT